MKKARPLYLNLLTDYGFKRIFGDPGCLMLFLNALLEKDGIVITSLKYLDRERTPNRRKDKLVFYDMLCQLQDGTRVIIEMQQRSQKFFKDRTFFYMGRQWVDQGRGKTDWDYDCDSVFGIFITNFHMPKDDCDFESSNDNSRIFKPVTEIVTMDRETHELYSLKNRMFIIDLKAFGKQNEQDLETDLEGWIFNLINMGNYTSKPKLAEKPQFERLFSLAEVANMTDTEYRKYSRSLKQYWDSCATEDKDNWRYERGVQYGEKRGEKRGEMRGIEIGKTEANIENALKMYNKGFDKDTVIDTLELSESEIVIFEEKIAEQSR